jgi:hypothetical protein
MAVDLSDDQFIASLKREVTPLGSTLFGGVADDEWLGYLTDAFWEAKLDGFLTGYVADEDGIVTHEASGPDLDRRYIALVVLYAGIKVLRNRILNMNTGFRAKAGPVEFEQQNSATMLAEMLKQLRTTKDRILEELEEAEATATMVLDALSVRTFDSASYWGSIELTG